MWIVRIALESAVHVRRAGRADPVRGTARDRAHADGHLSQHQHPRRRVRLELRRHVGRGDVVPDRLQLRARASRPLVNDIEHIESQHAARHRRSSRSSSSRAPRSRRPSRRSTAISQTVLRQLPPGTNAAVHHHVQRVDACRSCSSALSGEGLSEQQLYDLGVNFLRTQLATVQGASIPHALRRQAARRSWWTSNPTALQAKGLVADRRGQRDQPRRT